MPPDAAVYVTLRPGQLAEDAAFFNLALRTDPGIARAEDELRDALGFDPFRRADWIRIGIDVDTPVAAALFRVDRAELDRVSRAVERGRPAPPAAFRHRIVARVADPARIDGFLRDLARQGLGARLKTRRQGDLVIVDLAAALGSRAAAAQVPRSTGGPGQGGALRLLGEGAVSAGLVFARTPSLLTASLLDRAVLAVRAAPPARRAALGKQARAEIQQCERDWSTAPAALFDDYAVAGRLEKSVWAVHGAWGLTPLGRSGLALAAADDGLLDAKAPRDAALVGQIFLAGTVELRALPRPAPLKDLASAGRSAAACGTVALWLAGLRDWPQLLGLALDELARDRTMGPIANGARNAAVVLRGFSREGEPDGVVAFSLDPAATLGPETLCRGARRETRRGVRQLDICAPPSGRGERLAWERLPGGGRGVALLSDGRAADWWAALPATKADPRPPLLARLQTQIGKLLGPALGGGAPMARGLLAGLLSSRATATLTLRRDGDLLRGDSRVDFAR